MIRRNDDPKSACADCPFTVECHAGTGSVWR